MDNKILGMIYIFLGALIIIFTASEFVIKAAIVIFGFYLIFKGLQLRNAQNILFHINRFWHHRF